MKAQRSPQPKVLRLAVVVDGLVCDELHQHAPGPVSFGQDYRNDVVLFGAQAPRRHTLFDFRQGRYFLDLPSHTRGKLSLGSKMITVGDLRRKLGGGDHLRVTLDPRAKGKLQIGDSTILFQFTSPKPRVSHGPFPIEYAVRIRDTVTALDSYSMAGSVAVLGSFFIYQYNQDYPEGELDLESLDPRMVAVMGLRKEEPPEPAVEEPKPEEEIPDEEAEPVRKPEPKELTEVLPDEPKEYSQRAMAEARSVGVARVLGTYGGPGEGTVFDVINSTENNLGELFAQGMTTTVMADGGDISPFVPGGTGITAHGAAVQTEGLAMADGPELDKVPGKQERKVAGVTKATQTDVFGDVDKTSIKAAIKHRTGALQHCYNKALRTQPDLAGKMTYTISISVMGSVTKVDIEEDTVGSSAVATCARAKIMGWRFPMGEAEEGAEVTFSVVFSGG